MAKINHENAYAQNIKPVKSEKGCNIEELDETIEPRLFDADNNILRPGIQNPVLYQLIIAFAAQDMLRRYLNGQPLLGHYETLNRSEAITM